MKYLKRFYAFLFYRCGNCDKRLPKGQDFCDKSCLEEAKIFETYGF